MAENRYQIPFNRPFFSDSALKNIKHLIENKGSLEGGGYFTKKCQALLEEKFNVSKVLLTNSCTVALEMAALLAGIEKGDEVVMPSYTFVSTANSVLMRGAVPVFVDININDLNIDCESIKNAITGKTKAIVPVHYAGNPCCMDEINNIAEENSLSVIEDAAQCINSFYKGKALGTFGDIGAVSFDWAKNIPVGECGAIYINDESLHERGDIIIEKGTNRKAFRDGRIDRYGWMDIGSSYYPNELTAAFLYAQLEKADQITERRRYIWNKYHVFFKEYEEKGILRRPHIIEGGIGNAHIYFVLMDSREERNAFLRYLQENSITALTHFVPLHSSPYGKKAARTSGSMTVTDDVFQRSLRLPMYAMSESEIDYILDVMESYFIKK